MWKAGFPASRQCVRASCQPQRPRRAGPLRVALLVAALLGVLVSMAGCGSPATPQANPPASKLAIAVIVLDHESVKHTPSDTTTLIIRLSLPQPGFITTYKDFYGTDAQTLVCDGVVMRVDLSTNIDDPYKGDYIGNLPLRTDQYTCVYSWGQGAQQALLAVPVLIPNVLHIQTPASRDIIQAPGPGSSDLTLTYAPAGYQSAQVTATATDFNKRTATSEPSADLGAITIATSAFPTLFSVGWGALTLTRSASIDNLKTLGSNAVFAKVSLDNYEQVDTIPVFWD